MSLVDVGPQNQFLWTYVSGPPLLRGGGALFACPLADDDPNRARDDGRPGREGRKIVHKL